MSKTTPSNEEINSILTTIAMEVQDSINGFGEITVTYGNAAFSKYGLTKSVKYEPENGVFEIHLFDTYAQPLKIQPSKLIGRKDADPDVHHFKPTLIFDGLIVEFECVN